MPPSEEELAAPTVAFRVFAQRPDARIETASWVQQAARFFARRIGLTVEKRYAGGAPFPAVDAVHVVLAPDAAPGGTRLCYARPRTDADLADADAVEARMGRAGLADLARRCPTVWLVEAAGDDDAVALTIAAVLASVLLGPILTPSGDALFGVKTARARLDALTPPRAP